jgi:hypothetical protein
MFSRFCGVAGFTGFSGDEELVMPGSKAMGPGSTGLSATVPVPPAPTVLSEGLGEAAPSSEGLGSGEPDTGRDGRVMGSLVVLVLGFGLVVTDVEGFGSADVPGSVALAEAPGVGLTPGAGAVPSLTEALAPGAAPLEPEGDTESVGSGEVSTFPAGASSCWPGTGSQGALELPESSVATMTTAYTAQAMPTRMPSRRNLRLRRPDSSTNTGPSEPS